MSKTNLALAAAAVLALAAGGAGAAYWLGAEPPSFETPTAAADANAPVRITWGDLSPPPETEEEIRAVEEMAAALSEYLGGAMIGPTSYGQGPGPGLVYHGTASGYILDGERFVEDYDDKRVEMAGYLLPLSFDHDGSTEFLLVPFIGACIHVPPPPPNQLVLIRTEEPHMPKTIFEAVTVTGAFSREIADTELARSGYRIDAEMIVSFE